MNGRQFKKLRRRIQAHGDIGIAKHVLIPHKFNTGLIDRYASWCYMNDKPEDIYIKEIDFTEELGRSGYIRAKAFKSKGYIDLYREAKAEISLWPVW